MLNRFLLSAICFFCITQLQAQTIWGKVAPEQFSVSTCAFDSTANAVVLIDSEVVSFRTAGNMFVSVYDVYKRIQVFNKEGFAYATVKIPYISGYSSQTFEQLEAQTINKNKDGKIEITKLKDNAFFTENKSDFFSEKKFAFADVAEGSILEYRYTIVSKSVGDLREWLFQDENIPTLRSSVTIKVPEYFHYTPTPLGGVLLNAYKTEPYNEWIGNTNVAGTTSYYMMVNIPALKKEAYLTTINDYLARMAFPLKTIAMPNQKTRVFAESWDVVVQQLMKNEHFGEHLNEFIGDQLGAAKQVAQGLNTKEEIIKAIYNRVTAKMKWDGSTFLYPSKRLSKSYSDGTGNTADINLLLISMLRAAGIKADPVLISTRSHGMIQRAYPRNSQFNNVLVYAETDSGMILLDAVGAFKPYQLLGSKNLNAQGLRVVKNTDETNGSYRAEWIDIYPSKNSSVTLTSTTRIDSMGGQNVKTAFMSTDYMAINYREDLEKDSVKDVMQNKIKFSEGFDVINSEVSNFKEVDKTLKVIMDIVKQGSNNEAKELYINPFPVKFQKENPFKLNKRTYPVDYGYPLQQNIQNTITIPANYKVSELPKSVKLKLEDGSASFSFLIGQSDNNIQINSSLKINKTQFQPDMYEDLKALYAKMIDAYNSLIVLERVN